MLDFVFLLIFVIFLTRYKIKKYIVSISNLQTEEQFYSNSLIIWKNTSYSTECGFICLSILCS